MEEVQTEKTRNEMKQEQYSQRDNLGGMIKQDRRKGGSWKKYAGYGLTAFLVCAAVVLLVFMFVQREEFKKFFSKLSSAAAPAIYGAAFAYLMNPFMKFFERNYIRILGKKAKNRKRLEKSARVVSIIITVIVVLLLISFLVYMLVPELTTTVTGLVNDLPDQYKKLQEWYWGLEIRQTQVGAVIDKSIIKAGERVEEFINENINLTMVTDIMKPVLSGAKSVFGVLYNTFVGLIFSIYILGYKEKLAGISKKVVYSIFKRKTGNVIIRISRQCDKKFSTSFTGKMIDSIVVGMICFLVMLIFRFPYAVLISVIIGVTNVIPFFGPIIGAVPCALLILFVNPLQCLYFIIMVIVLQQLDANVLTPKIVGDSIGLSPIWVLFACVFFGGIWGLLGMLLAVPLMACIYMIFKEIVEYRLYRKGLDLETEYYTKIKYVDETEIVRLGGHAEFGEVTSEEIAAEKSDGSEKDENEKSENDNKESLDNSKNLKESKSDIDNDDVNVAGSEEKHILADVKNALTKIINKKNDNGTNNGNKN
ncbi:MAG: AI-2E family transporter [Lachnospiraceae bacterium]|nr:AI-2E family transporter [Lachnospiraceae bacterium]